MSDTVRPRAMEPLTLLGMQKLDYSAANCNATTDRQHYAQPLSPAVSHGNRS